MHFSHVQRIHDNFIDCVEGVLPTKFRGKLCPEKKASIR
jgi:hypothetical protein